MMRTFKTLYPRRLQVKPPPKHTTYPQIRGAQERIYDVPTSARALAVVCRANSSKDTLRTLATHSAV